MKSSKTFFVLIVSAVIGFVLWMNITEGHFQQGYCSCSYGYYTNLDIERQKENSDKVTGHIDTPWGKAPIKSPCPMCTWNPVNSIYQAIAKIDFNK